MNRGKDVRVFQRSVDDTCLHLFLPLVAGLKHKSGYLGRVFF
jgi:hypothetical protein